MNDAKEKRQVRLILIGLMLGMLLSSLDQTIISTAMPKVISALGGFSLYSWVFSIYMLTSTTAVPIFGKLADLYGRRRIYLIGMGFFIVGSALCGLSHNMTELIIFRGIQGIGAGALMPLAMTIIGDIYPPEQRGKMQGLFGAVFGLSSVIGPAIGGLIVDRINWQWIFYVNLPLGIAAGITLAIALKEKKSAEKRSVDWFGAITLSGAIVSILLALVLGGPDKPGSTHFAWSSPQIIGMFTIGAFLIALFIWIESKVKEPIIPLYLFKSRVITTSSIAGFFMGAGMFGAITYIPLYVQGVVGTSAELAGYVLTPLMLSLITSSILGGRIISKVSYRTIVVAGMAVMAIGFMFMSQMNVNTSNGTIIIYMIITGFGMGPLMSTFTIAVQSSVNPEQRGVATSSSQFFRSIGGTMGVTIMGALMANRMSSGLTELGKQLTQFPQETLMKFSNAQLLLTKETRDAMPPELFVGVRQVLADSIDLVFLSGTLLVVLGLTAGLFMGKERLRKSESKTQADKTTAKNPKVEIEMI